MNVLQTTRVAVRALLRNKTRAFLTTLGIIIGVGAVIAMVAIGEGAKQRVEEAFSSMGTNLLILMPGSSTTGGAQGGFGSQPTLTWDDLRAIQNEAASVKYASAQLRTTAQVVSDDANWGTSIYGVAPEYFDIRAWTMGRGSRFTQGDLDAGNKVVILGQTVVDKLYGPSADPVGLSVRIKNIPFSVIAVAARKGQSPMGQDYDDGVWVPYTTYNQKIQGGLKSYISGVIFIGASSPTDTARAQKDITSLLRDRHHLGQGVDDDFSIRNLTEIAAAQQQGTNTLTTLLAAIAAVSLLVGGIGIMNIMLVSVTERTREIVLRLAVGARPRDVLLQFLVEALVLSVMGGIIGIAAGLGVARWLAASFGWPTLVRMDIILISVGFSALVGIGFGLYPARKASRLDPIDALRYE